jgi:hypothetical protein
MVALTWSYRTAVIYRTRGGKSGAHGREYDTETGKQYEATNIDNEATEADDCPVVHKQLRNMLFQRMRGTTDNCTAPLADPLKSAPLLESPRQSDVWFDDIPNNTPEETSAGAGSNGKGWICLKSHVSRGDLLLKLPSQEEEEELRRRRSNLTRHTFEEFQTGTNFSVKQCLLAIMAYMGVSIVIFSFVLEPHWTMIDSCYFAVSTFTTLGTYVLESIILLLSC